MKDDGKTYRLSMITAMLALTLSIVSCSKRDDDKVYSGSWIVEYQYEDNAQGILGIAAGAKAVSGNGQVLARARLLNLLSENKQLIGVEVEETHFDMKGNVKYRCISHFDFPLGRKTLEKDAKGIKHTDFFSQWPVVRTPMGGLP